MPTSAASSSCCASSAAASCSKRTPERGTMSAPDSPYPDLPDGPGGAGSPSPMDLLASAQEAMVAQMEAAARTVEGSAGGGVVRVTMTGGGEVTGITIAPAVVDPDDVEMLQDLVLAALRDANAQVVELQRAAL